ncbi:hypothetical protein D3C72_1091940 [compost metagenome]
MQDACYTGSYFYVLSYYLLQCGVEHVFIDIVSVLADQVYRALAGNPVYGTHIHTVGTIQAIPVDLHAAWICQQVIALCIGHGLICTSGIVQVIARQVAVVIGTGVHCIVPIEGGIAIIAGLEAQ